MGRSKKAKAPKSPPKSCETGSSPEGKKTGRKRRKTAAAIASEAQQSEESSDEPEVFVPTTATLKVPARVVWDKYPERTERLLDYLDAHPDIIIKLFGDSIQAAKLEGRSKLTAKSSKITAYLQVADGVFSIDDDLAVRTDFASNPSKYAKAIDNYMINT
jgi:hypothetical protein